MWTTHTEVLSNAQRKLTITSGAAPMSFDAVLRCLHDDAGFRSYFSCELADMPFTDLRWETPAITLATLAHPFECVVLDSPGLDRTPDPNAFDEHFRSNPGSKVVTFANLGGDATLIVPTPSTSTSTYAHLASFLRNAPENQKHALWIAVSAAMRARISTKPVWLNTAGAGVAWLHIRLDDRPKYYHHASYRVTAS